MRIDQYLVANHFFDSRNKAQNAIEQQAIMVNNKIVTKSSFDVVEGDKVEVLLQTDKYVSRGGYKLEAAINAFSLDFNDKIVLDIGASTGGFTDCSLQHGAKLVYSIDVGTSQLVKALKENSKVVSMENTNILDVMRLPHQPDIIVMDVSFVSIEKIIPAIQRFLTDSNYLICLIKPQFEAGKEYNKTGVIKDKKVHLKVLNRVSQYFNLNNLYISSIISSPILGGSGNKEFICYVSKQKKIQLDFKKVVEQ